MAESRYNERSWAIDLISEINSYVNSIDIRIKRAGGERTLISPSKKLFPDVLLFGDEYSGIILQGWELKFPDTSIDDNELIENASNKAIILGLNSFLVWNVSVAVLYIKNEYNNFMPIKTWDDLIHIDSRDMVESSRNQWTILLKKILIDLNEFLIEGTIKSRTILESFSEEGVIDLILRNTPRISKYLLENSGKDVEFDAVVDGWWRSIRKEYPYEDKPWTILAKIILVTWINKLLFAHVIKTYYTVASKVNDLKEGSSIKEAINTFRSISKSCDFLNIFKEQLGEQFVDDQAWREIIQLNQLLSDFRLEKIDQELLHKLLQKTIHLTKRKTAGQFITPYVLSEILVRLTVEDKNKIVLDPCCGTGTIVKALYNIKKEYGINNNEAIKTIWASDKYSYPVQITTLSLAFAENIRKIIQVFQSDVIDLEIGKEILFINPDNGKDIKKAIKKFDYIVSNLPFVQFEDIDIVNPKIKSINNTLKKITNLDITIPTNADLYAYIPFYLWFLLNENGKLGIIISNAWLGTDYAGIFRKILQKFFIIESVITSGKSRWFKETQVVTNLLILKKRKNINYEDNIKYNEFKNNSEEETSFIVLKKTLYEIGNQTKSVASDIITNNTESKFVSIHKYKRKDIESFELYGLEWSSFFTCLSWFLQIKDKLIKANSIFEIKRGERRGWDKLFFPPPDNKIEKEYMKPVLKSPTSIYRLIAMPEAEAFCCPRSIQELESLGHYGALSWIRKFENKVNGKGKPLVEVLAKPGKYWYEMKDKTFADLVALINYDKRLFISRLKKRSFVNQRFIRFTITEKNLDIELLQALLNSSIGLFYLEALGFGRGLGALDLNTTKVRNQLFMLNPSILNEKQKSEIKKRFLPLKEREIYPLIREINEKDRISFDNVVLEYFGIINIKDKIIQSLFDLYNIRKSVDI